MGGHGTRPLIDGFQTVGMRRRRAVHDLVGMPQTSGGATRPGQAGQDAIE
jgi:hypothetical protein